MMRKWGWALIGMSLLGVTYANDVLTITPSTASLAMRSDGLSSMLFTVKNNTTVAISNITVLPPGNWPAGGGQSSGFTIQNDHCSGATLAANIGTCTFGVVIRGANQPLNFQMIPEVCGFSGQVCSMPISSNRPVVTVNQINHTVYAYVGLSSGPYVNQVLPINTANYQFATPLSGFNFTNDTGWSYVAFSADGAKLYIPEDREGTGGPGILTTVDTATGQLITTVVPVGSLSAAVSPDGKKVYVGNEFTGISSLGGVSAIDTTTTPYTITTIPDPNHDIAYPYGMAMSPDGSQLYVVDSNSNIVTVINTASNSIVGNITVGDIPQGIAFSPDGSKVYVANSGSNTVSVINVANRTVIATIPVVNVPHGLAVSPDGNRVYVACDSSNSVSVIDTASNIVIATISNLGMASYGVSLTPDGTRLYVTSFSTGNNIYVIDTSTNQVVQVIDVNGGDIILGSFIG